MKNKNSLGFTVIELLLVIAIIGILSTISFSSFSASITKGRDTTRKNDVSQLRKALENFNNQFGSYPDSDNSTHKILGCMDLPADPFKVCPAANGSFRYYVNGQEENSLKKFPTDPDPNRIYYYVKPDPASAEADSYAIFVSLENSQDKDVKKLSAGGAVDPDGWGILCGTATCNYKVSNFGLETYAN